MLLALLDPEGARRRRGIDCEEGLHYHLYLHRALTLFGIWTGTTSSNLTVLPYT